MNDFQVIIQNNSLNLQNDTNDSLENQLSNSDSEDKFQELENTYKAQLQKNKQLSQELGNIKIDFKTKFESLQEEIMLKNSQIQELKKSKFDAKFQSKNLKIELQNSETSCQVYLEKNEHLEKAVKFSNKSLKDLKSELSLVKKDFSDMKKRVHLTNNEICENFLLTNTHKHLILNYYIRQNSL